MCCIECRAALTAVISLAEKLTGEKMVVDVLGDDGHLYSFTGGKCRWQISQSEPSDSASAGLERRPMPESPYAGHPDSPQSAAESV